MDDPDNENEGQQRAQGQERTHRGIIHWTLRQSDLLTVTASAARLINTLTSHSLRPPLHYNGWHADSVGDDDDDDDDFGLFGYRRPARRAGTDQFPPVPNEAGMELMGSGDFGSNSHYVDDLKKRKKALATKLMWRELGIDTLGTQRRTAQSIFQVGVYELEYAVPKLNRG